MKNLLILFATVLFAAPAFAIRIPGESSEERNQRFDWERHQRQETFEQEANASKRDLEDMLMAPDLLATVGINESVANPNLGLNGQYWVKVSDLRFHSETKNLEITRPNGDVLRIRFNDSLEGLVFMDFVRRLDILVTLKISGHMSDHLEVIRPYLNQNHPSISRKLRSLLRAYEQRPEVLQSIPALAERACRDVFSPIERAPQNPFARRKYEIGL